MVHTEVVRTSRCTSTGAATLLSVLVAVLVALLELFEVELEQSVAAPAE